MIDIILVCLLVVLIGCGVMLWRNGRTFEFRMRLLSEISRAGSDAIDRGEYYLTRVYFDAFDRVGYDRTLWMFWRPMERHYRGTVLEPLLNSARREKRITRPSG